VDGSSWYVPTWHGLQVLGTKALVYLPTPQQCLVAIFALDPALRNMLVFSAVEVMNAPQRVWL
jgi:hypothetical protein